MAIQFPGTTSVYAEVDPDWPAWVEAAEAPNLGLITFGCRFKPLAASPAGHLFGWGSSANNNSICLLWITAGKAEFFYSPDNGGPFIHTIPNVTISQNGIYTISASLISNTERVCFVNGTKATTTTAVGASQAQSGNRLGIGCMLRAGVTNPFYGLVWDCFANTVWSDADHAAFYAGTSPADIKTSTLLEHWQFATDPLVYTGSISGKVFAPTGVPTFAASPYGNPPATDLVGYVSTYGSEPYGRMTYGGGLSTEPGGGGGSSIAAIAAHYARLRRSA